MGPKLLIDRLKGKRHPQFLERLGKNIPNPGAKTPVIWIHGVSVGEIKAVKPFFSNLKAQYPSAFFFITTTTATGQQEARRSLEGADAYRYLPLDFPWVVRKFVKRLHPQFFFLIESDFWPNLLKALQKEGCRNIVISAKISERSFRRFKFFSPFAKKLFAGFEKVCAQNKLYAERFSHFVPSNQLYMTGNLKWDMPVQKLQRPSWAEAISLPVLTLASTHAPEEKDILAALKGLDALIFLAPRHPERYGELAKWLSQENIPFLRLSQLESEPLQETRIVLVDAMGQLPLCYGLSQAAIVGGSFVSHVGGHNIFEPCLYDCPPFFGPHMFTQGEFVEKILAAGGGVQCPLEDLRAHLERHLQNPVFLRASLPTLCSLLRGATERTLAAIGGKEKC